MRSHSHPPMVSQVGIRMVELTAEKIAKIRTSPQAQLRTARYKKAVYLVGEFVFKGPYKADETSLLNAASGFLMGSPYML